MHLQFVAFNSNYKILLLISHSRVLVFLFTHRSPPLLKEELTLSSDTFMCYTCEQLLCYSLLCGLPERNDRNSNYNVVRLKCLYYLIQLLMRKRLHFARLCTDHSGELFSFTLGEEPRPTWYQHWSLLKNSVNVSLNHFYIDCLKPIAGHYKNLWIWCVFFHSREYYHYF